MSKADADYGTLMDEVDRLVRRIDQALIDHVPGGLKPTVNDVDDLVLAKGALRRAFWHLSRRKAGA